MIYAQQFKRINNVLNPPLEERVWVMRGYKEFPSKERMFDALYEDYEDWFLYISVHDKREWTFFRWSSPEACTEIVSIPENDEDRRIVNIMRAVSTDLMEATREYNAKNNVS